MLCLILFEGMVIKIWRVGILVGRFRVSGFRIAIEIESYLKPGFADT